MPAAALKEFKTNNAAHLDNEPDAQYRLPEQEIAGQGEEEAKQEESQEAEQQPENFNFENRHSLKKLVKAESFMDHEVPMKPVDVANMDNLKEHLAELVAG